MGSMRVAMVTRDYPPTTGGVPIAVYSLVRELRSAGVDVDVFEGKSNHGALLMPLREILRSSHYDIVHVQSGPFGAFASKHPLVVTLHSTLLEEAKYYTLKNAMRVPVAYPLERMTLSNADAIITDSKFATDALVRGYHIPQDKITLIRLGVDAVNYNPNRKQDSGIPKILICSRLDPRKNIAEALEALSQISSAAYELNVVGEGPEKTRLTELALRSGSSAKFLGNVAQSDIYRIFSESKIFVSTSLSEGFGLSVLQAMASGCAVVLSDIPTHRELVNHGEDGLIYRYPEELVSQISNLLADSTLIDRLARKAREKAKSQSWARTATEVISLYRRLLQF